MSITTKQSAGLCEVRIEGEMTLPGINEAREALVAAMDATESIRLDLGGLSNADLSCLQVFCAVHRSALKRGKDLAVAVQPSPFFGETMKRAGYSNDAGCRNNGRCLFGGASRE